MSENNGSSGKQWHVWSARPNKFDIVANFIKDKIPQVKEVLYPTVVAEKTTAKGEVKKKKAPLYAGYLFLQYDDDPHVWHKLNDHPFITRYVGRCTENDLYSVYNLRNVENLNKEESKEFLVGDRVKVNGGPFKGLSGNILIVRPNYIQVGVEVFGRPVKAAFDPSDLDIVERI